MHNNSKGEEYMSDYIFKRYEEYRDKCDALTRELDALKATSPKQNESGMTDFQFKAYVELRDKCEALERKNEELYNTVKSCVNEGKTADEILKAIETLVN